MLLIRKKKGKKFILTSAHGKLPCHCATSMLWSSRVWMMNLRAGNNNDTPSRVGYRSHLNRYQYRYRYLEFGTGTQRYLFSVLYSLCNNINIYFSEKISPKLSISIFWTIGPYNFFSSRNFCVLFFSNNQMKAWNIYLFLIKWKLNPFIFLANKQRFTVKIKVIIVLNF